MRLTALVLCCIAALPVQAEPVSYLLDRAASTVAFGYVMAGQHARGTMPVETAEIWLDLDQVGNSRVAATLDPAGAGAGLIFATQAMRGPLVLDTGRYPRITFRSTSVRGSLAGAVVEGQITIRDVTRPITLDAQVFRQRGTALGDRDRLSILLRGSVSRSAFGASGYPDLVGDTVTLDVLVRLDRAR